jgi:hypothetical protein
MTCQKIKEEYAIPGKALGRHIEHDERSKEWRYEVAQKPKLKGVRHRLYGEPLNQGNMRSCTGNAVCGALNTSPLHIANTKLLGEEDAVAVYSLATNIDDFRGQYPPDDTGSSGLAAAKAAQQKGLITEYRHAFGIEDALAALMERAVITGVPWYEGFDNPNDFGHVKIEGQARGGHEFVVLGYEISAKCIIALNSWGYGWGIRGRFRFSIPDWTRLLEEQGDVTILIK